MDKAGPNVMAPSLFDEINLLIEELHYKLNDINSLSRELNYILFGENGEMCNDDASCMKEPEGNMEKVRTSLVTLMEKVTVLREKQMYQGRKLLPAEQYASWSQSNTSKVARG